MFWNSFIWLAERSCSDRKADDDFFGTLAAAATGAALAAGGAAAAGCSNLGGCVWLVGVVGVGGVWVTFGVTSSDERYREGKK